MLKNWLKSRNIITLGSFALVILEGCFLSVFAQQSERYPTATELQRLREQLRQQIPSIPNDRGQDLRTPAEKERRESFIRAWSKVDPSVAPFLGNWFGYEESLTIYPSQTKGRVCLIYTGIQEAELSFGTVANGQIRTNQREVILKEGDYLGIASVRASESALLGETPYHSPGPVEAARAIAQLSGTTAQEVEQVVRQFNAAGCTASLPSTR